MNVSPSKENILKKIRQALIHPVPVPFTQSEGNSSVFHPPADDLAVQFAKEFTALQGKFIYCTTESEMAVQLQQVMVARRWQKVVCNEKKWPEILQRHGVQLPLHERLADSDAAITGCELLVSRTGTIVLSSASESGRTTSIYTPVHICIAYAGQLVYDLKDALQHLREKYGAELPSFITFATGPSRTADIEKTLVVGVHGPKEVWVFLIDGPPTA